MTVRKKGELSELIAAGNITGLFKAKVLGSRSELAWALMTIVGVTRKGRKSLIRAEYLDSDHNEKADIVCFSTEPLIAVGDFISAKADVFSYFVKEILAEIRFCNGDDIDEKLAESAKKAAQHPPALDMQNGIKKPSPKQSLLQSLLFENVDAANRQHFMPQRGLLSAFIERLRGTVKSYAQKGIRKPRDVAMKLNSDNVATASGAKWTPKLAAALLKILFDKRSLPVSNKQKTGTAIKSVAKNFEKVDSQQSEPLSRADMVKKLSALGRVNGKR